MTPRAIATLLILGAVWGASFLFIKVVVEETSPLELVLGRLFFGSLAVGAVLMIRRARIAPSPALWGKVLTMAALSNVAPFLLIAWAEIHIDSGIASVLNSTTPLFTAVFAAAILAEERMSLARLGGLLVGFLGVTVLIGGDIVDITDSSVAGHLAVIGAAACYGAGAVYARILLRSEDPFSLSGLQLLAGTLLVLPLMLAVEGGQPDYSLSLKAWLSLLALGILGSGFAYLAYLWLVDRVGSVRTSLVTYIIPIVGLLLGWAVLDEAVGVNTLLGSALIIAGVASVMRGEAPSVQRATAAATVDAPAD